MVESCLVTERHDIIIWLTTMHVRPMLLFVAARKFRKNDMCLLSNFRIEYEMLKWFGEDRESIYWKECYG